MAYSTISKPSLHFNTKLYTGNGNSNHAQTGVGFQPDLLWNKSRSSGDNHLLFDAVRGSTKSISSDTSSAEATRDSTFLTSFDSDGFTVGSNGNINGSGATFANWCWKAGGGQGSSNTDGSINTSYTSVNTTAGFSISKYTGTGSNATFGHGLNAIPKLVLIKRLNGTQSTRVGHYELGWSSRLYLDSTSAQADGSDSWNGDPTSSLINLSTESGVNGSGSEHIAYCFAEKTGYSKFGKYTGNGSTDGTFIYTGFKPAFVMLKGSSIAEAWWMFDNKRSESNVTNDGIIANGSNTEYSNSATFKIDMLSNGFKTRDGDGSTNGHNQTYIFMAFAEEPLVANVSSSIPATAR